jgi:hypothetical protein
MGFFYLGPFIAAELQVGGLPRKVVRRVSSLSSVSHVQSVLMVRDRIGASVFAGEAVVSV